MMNGGEIKEEVNFFEDVNQQEALEKGLIKLTKSTFRSYFYPLLVEIIQDRELLVRQEGIDCFIDMMPFLQRLDVEKELIAKVRDTMVELTCDDFSDDNAEIRMS